MWLFLYLLSEAKGAQGCEGLTCQLEWNHYSSVQHRTNSTKRCRKTPLGLSQAFPWNLGGPEASENLKTGLSPPGKHVLCSFPCEVWGTRYAVSLPAGLHTTSKVCQWQVYLQLPASWCCLDQGEVPVEMEILWRLLASTGRDKVENGFSRILQLNWNSWGGTQVFLVNWAFTKPKS